MTPEQRRALINALCELPQFQTDRDRRSFIRAAFEGREYSADMEKALTWLDLAGNRQTVADEFVRHIEGRELAPGVSAISVLIAAITPAAGLAHKEALAELTGPRPVPALPPGSGFDVFLCHNSRDKSEVRKVALLLIESGLRPWLDEWELRPGIPWQPEIERQFSLIKSAAVFLGGAGDAGRWQQKEAQAMLSLFENDHRPVIPVFLETAPAGAKFSPFLNSNAFVDFRQKDPDPLDQLIFGITGQHPKRSAATAQANP